MLLAEVHGKRAPDVEGLEDALTSAVFGHLRYVSVVPLWAEIFRRARRTGGESGRTSLAEHLASHALDMSAVRGATLHFWPSHRQYGEPDLIAVFRGEGQPDFAVLIEVKLWSGKHGHGAHDQLIRYLKAMDHPDGFDRPRDLPRHLDAPLVYLTPRDARSEVEGSIHAAGGQGDAVRERIYTLMWQDVANAVEATLRATHGDPVQHRILKDVRAFLRTRGLLHFSGFRKPRPGPPDDFDARFFHSPGPREFAGWRDPIPGVRVMKSMEAGHEPE